MEGVAGAVHGSEQLEIVRTYYEYIDKDDVDAFIPLFDTDIIYEREGTPTIHGINAMRHFYEHDRIIARGIHEKIVCTHLGNKVAAHGIFIGTLKNGERVVVRFEDLFEFNAQGKIACRKTSFPPGERHI